MSIDSSELKEIVDSDYIKFITGQSTSRNFVDSAYVEQNSLDSERGLNLINAEFGEIKFSLIPNADSAIDLGSSTKKFRKLFLSGNTIQLGELSISDSSGVLVVRDSDGLVTKLDLSANSTNDLKESDNLYYTRARFDSALGDTTSRTKVRSYLNLIDAGGDGSLAYDSALGKLTYTGPSAAEVRAHLNGGHGIVYSTSTGNISVDSSEVRGLFSAGGDLSYNSGTGQFTFDVESVYTQANFESDLSLSLNATNGIAYDSARHKLSLINTGVDSAIYGSSTRVPVLTINAQGRVDSAGSVLVAGVTGVSFDSGTETITISTADGNSFSTAIGGYDNLQATTFTGTNAAIDSAIVTDISGSSLNYDSGSVNEFTATNITADSAVISFVSGGSANYDSGNINVLSVTTLTTTTVDADSSSIFDISGSSLNYDSGSVNQFTATNITADSAVITDISGATANYPTIISSQLSADSASITTIDNNVLRTNDLNADSAIITDISGNTLTFVSGHIGELDVDSAQIGNLRIAGDLTVAGETVTVSASTLTIQDPLIHLADSNIVSDVSDIGFIGHYYRDAQRRLTGLFRDASNDQYYLFRNLIDSAFDSSVPPSVINRSGTGFAKANLNVASLLADSATLTNITVTGLSTSTVGADSSSIFNISGSSLNYDSGSVNQFTATNITADSAVITDISGTSVNVTTGLISQLSADSARATNFTAATATIDSAIVTDISGTTVNYDTGLISQLSADSAYATRLEANIARINGISGDSASFTNLIAGDTLTVGGKLIPIHVDSAYIETVSLDSERAIALIDSDYINLRAFNLTRPEFKFNLSDDGAAAGPRIVYDRNSSSPADSDALTSIEFRGRNSSDSAISYAQIKTFINDASANTEAAEMHFVVTQSGVQRTKMKFTPTGIVLAGNEKVAFSDDSFHQLLTPGDYTSDHALTLPDSTGTIMTREFITTLVDSAYVSLRQGASTINLEIDDSAGAQKLLVPITQAATIATGAAIGFGNTISVLLTDSSAFTISL